jgi:hypothetical protein
MKITPSIFADAAYPAKMNHSWCKQATKSKTGETPIFTDEFTAFSKAKSAVEFSTQNTESIEDAHSLYLYQYSAQPDWKWEVSTKQPEKATFNLLKSATNAKSRIEKLLAHLEK